MFNLYSKFGLSAALLAASITAQAAVDLTLRWDKTVAAIPQQLELSNGLSLAVKQLTPASKQQVQSLKITVTDEQELEQVIFLLRKLAAVRVVEKDQKVRALAAPNDDSYPNQSHHSLINSPTGWDQQTDCRDIKIAILDSGIDLDHADLAANIWQNTAEIAANGIDDDNNGYVDDVNGYNFVEDNSSLPEDDGGHGSHVAGLLGAVANNQLGVAGVCWQANLIPVRVLQDRSGSLADVQAGIAYATAVGARIIVMSLEFDDFSQALLDVMKEAEQTNDALFVIAAGNAGQDLDKKAVYPASYSNVLNNLIGVANVNEQLAVHANSNTGVQTLDIAAPGVELLSSWLDNSYKVQTGTSMSAPLVAGAAALALAQQPNLSSRQLRSAILHSISASSDSEWATKAGGSFDFINLFDNTSNTPVSLFAIDNTDATKLTGYGLADTTSVKFYQFNANETTSSEVSFTADNDNQLSLAAAATRPGYYQVTTSNGQSNRLVSWQANSPAIAANIKVSDSGENKLIAWDAVTGADKYWLDRSVDGEWTELTSTEETSYTDTSAPENDSLMYRLRSSYSYLDPTTTQAQVAFSDYSDAVSSSGEVASAGWLTETIAQVAETVSFINIRLQTADDENNNLTYSLNSGSLPNNVKLSSKLGHLVGDPVQTGTFNFSVTYTNGSTITGTRAFTLIVGDDGANELTEPNSNTLMRFSLSKGQFTSLQTKSDPDLALKSVRLTAYDFDKAYSQVSVIAEPKQQSPGRIAKLHAKLAEGGWRELDSTDAKLALASGMSWLVDDNGDYDLNSKDKLIEVEFAIEYSTDTSTGTDTGEQTATSSSSSGGSAWWLISLLGLGLLRRR